MPLVDALISAGISKSKRDARTLIQQGSIQLNGVKITDTAAVLHAEEAFDHEFSILKKGKKNYFVLNFRK